MINNYDYGVKVLNVNKNQTVKETLLDRRTIRRYAREAVSEEDLDFIREAIRNTPTSYNGQQYSVIEVDDQKLKEELAEIVGQKQFKTSARVFMFLSDFNKIATAAQAKNLEYSPFETTADGLIVGTIDASLAMMSAIVAATSRGLATCPIGYARTVAPEKISEILGLPKGVYLVCALSVGIPAEMPDQHPKQPQDLIFFKNKYGVDGLAEKMLEYDRTIEEYNRKRSGSKSDNDWIGHIVGYYAEGMKYDMLKALKAQGYTMTR